MQTGRDIRPELQARDPENSKLLTYSFHIIGLIILALRFTQGWIYWGGGSRRFIYAPQKLDPHAPEWMANKLQSAMPGALFDIDKVIAFLLQHFWLLYGAIIAFSLVELLAGLGLLLGLFTRLSAFITALLSIVLMLLFGWQGSTCLDEWTMAVSSLSMGLTLMITGAGAFSVDHFWSQRMTTLTTKKWFLIFNSGPLSLKHVRILSIGSFIFSVLFTLVTYNYYRGAIFSPYHAGPVSGAKTHISITNPEVLASGELAFNLAVDAGSPADNNVIVRVELINPKNEIIESWSSANLAHIPDNNVKNTFLYNQINIGPFGIRAPLSAKARIILPAVTTSVFQPHGNYRITVFTADGMRFESAEFS